MKKMIKKRIVKKWELQATCQKSFANMGNQYYGIPFACR